MLVINNIDFPYPLKRRNGAEKDSESLKATFEKLNFLVTVKQNRNAQVSSKRNVNTGDA